MVHDTNPNATIACTNGNDIMINAGCSLVINQVDREMRFEAIRGLMAHEMGHVLFTNFATEEMCLSKLKRGKLYPTPVKVKSPSFIAGKRRMTECLNDPDRAKFLIEIINDFDNHLDDGYVEDRIFELNPGVLAKGLKVVRETQWETTPNLNQLIQEERAEPGLVYRSICSLILSYVRFGEFKLTDKREIKDERVQAVCRCLSYIDEYLINRKSSLERWSNMYTCLILLWDYVEDYIQWRIDHPKTNDSSGGGNGTGNSSGAFSNSPAGGSKPTGVNSPTAEDEEEEESGAGSNTSSKPKLSVVAKKRQKTKAVAEKGSGEDEGESEGASESENKDDANDASAPGVENASDGDNGDESQNSEGAAGHTDGTEQNSAPDKEGERIPFHESDEIESHEDEEADIEYDDSYEGTGYNNAANDIERLLDKMATSEAEKELENELERDLNNFAQNINYGNAHRGVPIRVKRMAEVPDSLIEQYNAVSAEINIIVNRTTRSIEQALKDKRQGGKNANLYIGRRLDTRSVYREDGRAFYNMKQPGGPPQTAFIIIIDESGSMSGERSTYARTTALIMRGVCDKLGIPCAIYGHTESGGQVVLYAYSDFDGYDNKDKYRIMDIGARGINRDGAALMYGAERILKRPEETKVAMLICDGQPNGSGYSGDKAEEDCRSIKKMMERKGVNLIVAAIGNDKENIHRIYDDSFMDITDLNRLPVVLPKRLLGYIKTV
jgi:cobalamin biosynthesis protein CobT